MAVFELLAVAYFLTMAVGAFFTRVPWPRRVAVSPAALAAAALVVINGRAGSDALRAWAPHVYLVMSYYLPALLVRAAPTAWFEAWLVASDYRWRAALPRLPPGLIDLTELAYLFCYPLVPASFSVVWTVGTPDDVSRFWVAVLGAGCVSYASLPWLVSRPPRLLDAPPVSTRRLRALNVQVLGRVSHQWNTFPSGHVAVSLAAAVIVTTVTPIPGLLASVVALAIAVGAVAGRYHYAIDVALGVAAGAAAATLALAF